MNEPQPTPSTPKSSVSTPGSRLAYAIHSDQHSPTNSALDSPPLSATELVKAALRLTSSLRVPDALRRLADSACSLTGAEWGTITVLNKADTDPNAPVSMGEPTLSPEALAGHASQAQPIGPAGAGVVVNNDLSVAQAFTGQIEGESPGCLLSAPLRLHSQVYGRLYLGDKPGGFTETDVTTVLMLADAAAVAVENARLYRESRDREKWMAVSQELTQTLLSGAEEDDALTLIAKRVREVARADASALILPSIGETWVCEIAEGKHANELLGTFFPPEGRAITTLRHQTGTIVESLAQAAQDHDLLVPVLAQFGPALYAPMIHRGRGVGVILLLRDLGEPPFTAQDLEIAELVAGQATMAFELADAQHAEEMATLLDQRAQIGRDLHDLAIQQLFATGMQISAARDRLRSGEKLDCQRVAEVLDSALSAVDDSVRQIRSIVRSLRDRDEDVSLVERLRREASLARTSLGFAPSLLLSVDGVGLSHAERGTEDQLITAIDAAIAEDIGDDMVAVVREGLSNVARHARASSVTVDVKLEGLPGTGGAEVGALDSGGCLPFAGKGQASGDSEPYVGQPVVEIVVRDDGVGVDPGVTRRSGTANMAERARRHGGSFVIGPRARSDGARRGTCFTWRVPLTRPGRKLVAPAGGPLPSHPGGHLGAALQTHLG
ncbi:Redox sensor histidine kinase response regulator devS [Actinomyces bovis]|uniref:Redox sensor histidine kinase response regulator devS n=1 Tax=Actinomyces bovis TaxID=1658 RepID=A0ABY1VLM5_9ACTO|nr:GAF domain-containing protein [Actinomyces bovis]SPT52581.1 Redox sensor histidine kinase response regulator devS [Actinomyces bovis]VEG54375.1 Redox sensor histidine kinase response regulator devS [Actinomyces israelii]